MKKPLVKIIVIVFCLLGIVAGSHFWLLKSGAADVISQNLTFAPGVAHAQTVFDSLTPGADPGSNWIFTVWNMLLALANVFCAIILLFFAFVNIAHIEYDTYQIKKVLPKLIIGIIMANFSLIICRLLVSVSNVLVVTFAPDTHKLSENIMRAFCFIPGTGATGPGIIGNGYFGDSLVNGVSITLMLVVTLIIVIAMLAMGIMLWIRRIIIFVLAAVSPIAFVMLAFPPTESYFKKWWDWEINWTFMGAIMIFLMYIASIVGTNQCQPPPLGDNFSFTLLLSSVALVILAVMVPFKLGGAIGSLVGGAMKKGAKYAAWDNGFAKRKREVMGGAIKNAFGNTRLGSWMNEGRKNDDMKIKDYEGRQANRDTDAATRINARDGRFQQTKHDTARANARLEAQEHITMEFILNGHGGAEALALAQENLDLLNAKNAVELTNTTAERGVRNTAGHSQTIMEKELANAKAGLEEDKLTRDEDVNEGNDIDGLLNNMTQAQIQHLTGGRASTIMELKQRYLEQANRLSTQKLRAEKRSGQDVQALAMRDSSRNDELRQTMSELTDAGIAIDSNMDMNTGQILTGPPQQITWTQAREAAERLRYAATSAQDDPDEQNRLIEASRNFDTMARHYQDGHAVYDPTMVANLRAAETRHTAAAAAAEATSLATGATAAQAAQARAPHDASAHRSAEAATRVQGIIDDANRRGTIATVHYNHYLTNNLAGRRQKIINPDIADEINTQVISTPAEDLCGDLLAVTPPGQPERMVGTGEARIGRTGMALVLNGRMNEVTKPQARAALVQIGAIQTVMNTARQGAAKGLNQMDDFFQLTNVVGNRPDFKRTAVNQAAGSMDPESQAWVQMAVLQQAGITVANTADAATTWSALTQTQQQDYLNNVQFSQLNLNGGGPGPSALKSFVDRTLGLVETDEAIALGASAGTKAGRSRRIDPSRFLENRP